MKNGTVKKRMTALALCLVMLTGLLAPRYAMAEEIGAGEASIAAAGETGAQNEAVPHPESEPPAGTANTQGNAQNTQAEDESQSGQPEQNEAVPQPESEPPAGTANAQDDAEDTQAEDGSQSGQPSEDAGSEEQAGTGKAPAAATNGTGAQSADETNAASVKDGSIGEMLDGDYAYVSFVRMEKAEDTDSKEEIRTGTAPWDAEDEKDTPGNDARDTDNVVRSFDTVTYTVEFETKMHAGAKYIGYKKGRVHFEFILPATEDEARFDTEAMTWLSAKDAEYEVTELTDGGVTYQVLKGSFIAQPSGNTEVAIGNTLQTVNIVVNVLAMKQGDTVEPGFTLWLEHNNVPETSIVTGQEYTCPTHGVQEYQTAVPTPVTVTSAPRYNVQLRQLGQEYSYVGSFDFSTGIESAPNKGAGVITEGRLLGYGVTLQIQGKSAQHGLRGCEIPDGSPIELDLDLSVLYDGKGEKTDITNDYMPLLWSIEGHSDKEGQTDGRELNGRYDYVPGQAPGNEGGGTDSCWQGGTWTGTQSGSTISITVSGYEVDLKELPNTDLGNTGDDDTYYDPQAIGANYWDIRDACFSAGEVWIVQPYYDGEDNYIQDKYGEGNFSLTVQDSSLKVTGVSGTELPASDTNDNQITTDDDEVLQVFPVRNDGTIGMFIAYTKYDASRVEYYKHALTQGCEENGRDWVLTDGELSIGGRLLHQSAEGESKGVAYDMLIKFDDDFFTPDGKIGQNNPGYHQECTYLFGAKRNGAGWDHRGLEPGDEGYDDEMRQATADDLIFFESLEELQAQGYTCVAVLAELRGIEPDSSAEIHWFVKGSVSPEAKVGSVYMTTFTGRAWNKQNVAEAAAEYCGKDVTALTDEDYNRYVQSDAFPSRANAQVSYDDYPSAFWTYDYSQSKNLREYQKSWYNEDGYAGGSLGADAGDSCLVEAYVTTVEKNPAQTNNEGGYKTSYDMDTNQREVDYKLNVKAVRVLGDGTTTADTSTTTTLYVEDTLSEHLEYIPGSAYYGGEYAMSPNGGGQKGTVTGGTQLFPEVIRNDDGTTTLRFTIEGVVVTTDNETAFDTIYYSCAIGTPGEEETDVKNGEEVENTVKVWTDDEQKKDFNTVNGNYAENGIRISKNLAVSLYKKADQDVVEAGQPMGFTMNFGNNGPNEAQVTAIDFLPYSGDTAGSSFTGACRVTELTLLDKDLMDSITLYYTTDPKHRDQKASAYNQDNINEQNGWTKLTLNGDGTVVLPEWDETLTAIAAVGKLPSNKKLQLHITLLLPEGKPGELVVNRFEQGTLESHARSYIVSRTLEGVVWLDANKDGLRELDEELLNGVKVTLLQKQEDGSYAPYMLDGKKLSVETGRQIDVLTGEVSENTAGAYKFTNLPAGEFAVLFGSGETVSLNDYMATLQNAGNDTRDSDAVPTLGEDGELISAQIEGIEMPGVEDLFLQLYLSSHNDFGIYPNLHTLTVSKTVTGTMGDRNKLFDFKLELKDAEGEPITGSFACTGDSIGDEIAAPENGTLEVKDGVAEFQLKHGQSITIEGLPQHCQYKVSEPDAAKDGYIVTAKGDTECDDMTVDAEVAFENNREPVTPTGILLDNWPAVLLMAMAIGGGVLLTVNSWRKRRMQSNM